MKNSPYSVESFPFVKKYDEKNAVSGSLNDVISTLEKRIDLTVKRAFVSKTGTKLKQTSGIFIVSNPVRVLTCCDS